MPGPHASPGSGSVYVIKSGPRAGQWRGTVTATLPDGTRQRVYVVGKDEASTRGALELRRAGLEGRLIEVEDIAPNVSQWLTRWLDGDVKPAKRPGTYESYLSRCVHIERHIGAIKLRDLSRSHVQALRSKLTADGLAPSTQAAVMSILRIALNAAVDLDLIDKSPAHRVRSPGSKLTKHTTLAPLDLGRVLDYAAETGHRHAVLFRLMAVTGLRRGEAIGLRWRDIHINEGTISVEQQITRSKSGGTVVSPPKTDHSRRLIEIAPLMVELLRQFRPADAQADELVFHPKRGTYYTLEAIDAAWREMLKAGGFRHVKLHELRHTHATLLLRSGTPPKVVSERLGHASIAVTLAIYGHNLPGMDAEAARAYEGLIWPVSGAVDGHVGGQRADLRAC